ncbi:hypothetical protein [Albimonas pacifica]|uniref:Uncharacterized protein n=1 Tax=Albimonas pacifica TaxID=1114924 RepID=A0A1I3PRQ5_9RHOB|nr:hypothetical protein [Albimonas pacifica]SFJ23676.1 hypothetical protein SAMN05216258_11928 [Albimonas pacifica]
MILFRLRPSRHASCARGGGAVALRRLAPALALLLAACAQGAGSAPDARPDDPEVLARARLIVEAFVTEEVYAEIVETSLDASRATSVAEVRTAGFTPGQAESLVDLMDEVALAARGTVVDVFSEIMVQTCSPIELDLAVPGQGLGPCARIRPEALSARSDDRLHRVFIPMLLEDWMAAVEANRLEFGMTLEQAAELRLAVEAEIAAFRDA